jgi:hypothetical protein
LPWRPSPLGQPSARWHLWPLLAVLSGSSIAQVLHPSAVLLVWLVLHPSAVLQVLLVLLPSAVLRVLLVLLPSAVLAQWGRLGLSPTPLRLLAPTLLHHAVSVLPSLPSPLHQPLPISAAGPPRLEVGALPKLRASWGIRREPAQPLATLPQPSLLLRP